MKRVLVLRAVKEMVRRSLSAYEMILRYSIQRHLVSDLCHGGLEVEVAELNYAEGVVPLQEPVVVVLPRGLVVLAGGAEVQRLGQHPAAACANLWSRGREHSQR